MKHDERFKLLLEAFLLEFFALFLPDLVDRLDFAAAVWLQQELITDPPAGTRRAIDLLVQLPLLEPAGAPPQTLLIHLEIESDDTVEPLRQRMYEYFHHLTHVKQFENVLPVALYLQVGLEGRGVDCYEVKVLNRKPLRFEYDYVGLPGLKGEPYLMGTNALGVALSALMQWPKAERARAAVDALERIVTSSETPRRKMLLCDCVNAYAPLDEEQKVELVSLLNDPRRKEVQMFGKTWFEQGQERGLELGLEQGQEKGMELGLQQGQRELLRDQLEARFAPLSATALQRLETWPVDRLRELGRALLTAQSLRELGLED